MKIAFNFESFLQKSNSGLFGLCIVRSPIDFSYEDFCVATFGFGFGKVKMKVRDMAGDMRFDLKILSSNQQIL
jgi:hypothetical protein